LIAYTILSPELLLADRLYAGVNNKADITPDKRNRAMM